MKSAKPHRFSRKIDALFALPKPNKSKQPPGPKVKQVRRPRGAPPSKGYK